MHPYAVHPLVLMGPRLLEFLGHDDFVLMIRGLETYLHHDDAEVL